MKDYINIDISPDRHVNKVFRRTNLVSRDADSLEVLYRARELNPEYPGIFDLSCFEIGRTYCHSRKLPECKSCYLENYCPRNFKVR